MSALAAPSGRLRWSLSAGLVLGAHAAVGILLVSRAVVMTPDPPPPAAVMIDMAPEPAPEPAPAPPPPPAAVETPPDPVPPPPEIVHTEAAVTLPKPPPPKPVHHKAPPPVTAPVANMTAPPSPQTSDAPPAPAQSAPAPGPVAPPAPAAANPTPSYLGQLMGHLARYKHYPVEARQAHVQGTVMLRFTMDREGHVLSFRIERTSGHAALDDEVSQMIERAQPLPAMPDDMPGAQLQLVIPVQFNLH